MKIEHKCDECKGTGFMLKTSKDYVEGGLCVKCGGTGVIYEDTQKPGNASFSQSWFDYEESYTKRWKKNVGRKRR